MIILACRIRLLSRMSLDEIGQILSTRVFGGIPFIGRTEYIRDEIPAIYSANSILGTRFVLMGEPDEEGYYLEADTSAGVISGFSPDQIRNSLVDIGPLVARLLENIDGISTRIKKFEHE